MLRDFKIKRRNSPNVPVNVKLHEHENKVMRVSSKRRNSPNVPVNVKLHEHENKVMRVSSKQLKSLETCLTGALRREQMSETAIKQLEAEIEQLNRLVRQREQENKCTKMMLKFREDKIQRMESVVAGSIPADSYLLEENNMLTEEIQMLRAKVDRNPEVTRFALENIRLLEQLRRFQDFYKQGEREMLLTEISELRNQLVLAREDNSKQDNHMQKESMQLSHTLVNNNETPAKYIEEVINLELKVDILDMILKEESSSRGVIEEEYKDVKDKLEEAKSVIEALESQQLICINELEDLRESNNRFSQEVHEKELKIMSLNDKILNLEAMHRPPSSNEAKCVQESLEKANNEEEMDEVRKQVEAEIGEVIVSLQGATLAMLEDCSEKDQVISQLSSQLSEKSCMIDQLSNEIKEKEGQIKGLEKENSNMCMVVEKFKEDLKVKDSILLDKEAEIHQHKAHITELNLHAEAHAREYKQTTEIGSNYKKKIMELEIEVTKLSGQQNLQHHHTKIKEENNALKTQNEELSLQLKRSVVILNRVKDELNNACAAYAYYVETELQLVDNLKKTEEERDHLAQKLAALCTSILKAAGVNIGESTSDYSLTMAEEAWEQLETHVAALQREVLDLQYKYVTSKIVSTHATNG